jgi:hypothetical protein
MPRPPIQNVTTFRDACEIVAEHLPEGWAIEIRLENGSGCVDLYREDYEQVHFYSHPDDGIHGELEAALTEAEEEHAKDCDDG